MQRTPTPRYIPLLLALFVSLFATHAHALDLQTAKQNGYVGEQASGYLGIVKNAQGVPELVADINSRRKAHYQTIAKTNGTSLNVVETLAGQKAIEKTPVGQYVMGASGNWVKKTE